RLPDSPAGGGIERGQKTVNVVVLVEDDFPIDQNGRTAGAVFVLKRTERMFPKFPAIEIVTDQAVTAEKHEQPLPVARGRRRRRTADGMRLFDALGCNGASPKRLSGLPIESERGQFLRLGAISRQKDSVFDQDWCGMSGIEQHAPEQGAGRV